MSRTQTRADSTPDPTLWRAAVAASLTALVLITLSACQASLEDKRGAPGDFCNGDSEQCRQGLLCKEGVCTSVNNSPDVCSDVCGRFEACGKKLGSCYKNCLATLETWSKEVTETYRNCYENEVSCQEIQDSQQPQNICYARLELPEARVERCETLRDTARRCLNEIDGDYEAQLNNFWDACRRKGRTTNDEAWSATQQCEDWATRDQPQCGRMFSCINDNFQLNEDFPTSPPSGGSSGGSTSGGSAQ